ncbi:hypothetical protein ODV28_08960, partial [Lactobacillus amylovorus]
TSIGNSQKTIAGKSGPYLSKLVFWLAQANEPLSPRLQSRVVDKYNLIPQIWDVVFQSWNNILFLWYIPKSLQTIVLFFVPLKIRIANVIKGIRKNVR